MHLHRSVGVVIMAATLTTAACGGGGSPEAGDGDQAEASGLSEAEERFAAIAAMDRAEQDRALASDAMDLALAAAKDSGLEEAIGGPEATRDALHASALPLLEAANTIEGESVPAALGRMIPRRAADIPSLGEGFFGGVIVSSLGAAVGVTSDVAAGKPTTEKLGEMFVATSAQNEATLSFDATNTDPDTGVTTKLSTRTTVVPCPDVDGRFDASSLIDVTVTKGNAGQHAILDVQVAGQVDDDAQLASYEMQYTMQWSRAGGSSSELVEVSGTHATDQGLSAPQVRRSEGAGEDLTASANAGGALFALHAERTLLRAAQTGWESGRCVRLETTPGRNSRNVEPGSTVAISAKPRSKMDGSPAGGTVMATLSEGATSVEPSATKLPADAEFTYIAPPEADDSGVVLLEARSRRGVAKAEVIFETRRPMAFHVVGGSDDLKVDQNVCDAEKPFQLSGGGVEVAFTGGLSGTYSYTGPFGATGGGTYTITLADDPTQPSTMVGQGTGSVTSPLGTFEAEGTETYTLTPIDRCIDDNDFVDPE